MAASDFLRDRSHTLVQGADWRADQWPRAKRNPNSSKVDWSNDRQERTSASRRSSLGSRSGSPTSDVCFQE